MKYEIITTEYFEHEFRNLFKKYRSLPDDFEKFKQELLENPKIGDDLGDNTRKIRIAIRSKNKGKRGGARIIAYTLLVSIEDTEIYLLSIYDKSEKASISKQEIEHLKMENGVK
ncbi:MAG: type II toxin-antitoxin system RelE/ParE family toxin [Paludibacter sp.]|jgi:hypothetical protein|nr:type II toxin-antitoxin system RelE/ParE family toxin [Paludibacter sp.]